MCQYKQSTTSNVSDLFCFQAWCRYLYHALVTLELNVIVQGIDYKVLSFNLSHKQLKYDSLTNFDVMSKRYL